jgi:hypothetical protein
LAAAYLEHINDVLRIRKQPHRNSRDRVFNIIVYKEDAQHLSANLYYEGCLSLPRKMTAALVVATWSRPPTMRAVANRRGWTAEEDAVVIAHPPAEAAELLGRSRSSVGMRRWRLSAVDAETTGV